MLMAMLMLMVLLLLLLSTLSSTTLLATTLLLLLHGRLLLSGSLLKVLDELRNGHACLGRILDQLPLHGLDLFRRRHGCRLPYRLLHRDDVWA